MQENEEKRINRVEEINFLGYKISCNKIKAKLERSPGIRDFERPKNKKELQRFIGLINYDRQLISNLSKFAKPLLKLISKETRFLWKDTHEIAFNQIKKIFKNELSRRIPDWDPQFTLEADA